MIPVVLYDNTCRLCCGVVSFLKKHNTKGDISFIPLLSAEGKQIEETSAAGKFPDGTVVFLDNQKFYYRSTAVLRVFKRMGGWWRLLFLFIIVPAPIRNFIYNLIASNRRFLAGEA